MPARGTRRAQFVAVLACGLTLLDCRRRHVPVDAAPELGYPSCADGGLASGFVVARGHIRGGPLSNEKNVSERFDLERTACGYTFRSPQERALDIRDIE